MTEAQRLSIDDLGQELESRRKDKAYKFVPHRRQLEFILATERTVGLVGGNRSGKSECGGWNLAMVARGEHPVRKLPKGGGKYWLVALDENMLRDIAWAKLRRYLPDRFIEKIRERPGFYYLKLKNGSEIWGKSCDSGEKKFQGQDLDGVHFDEEPPEPVWDETATRLIDRGGWRTIAMTPIAGSAWFYRRVYKNRDLDKAGRRKVRMVTLSLYDNPHIDREYIQDFIETLQRKGSGDDEIRVRVHGDYILWAGRNVFDARNLEPLLRKQEMACVQEGQFELSGSFTKRPRGYIKLWELPNPDHTYVIGADAAQGKQSDDMDSGGDFSAAHVYCLNTNKQVGQLHARIDTYVFANALFHMAHLYNAAWIAVEAERFGVAVLAELAQRKYPHIYYQREMGKRVERRTKRLGWQANAMAKAKAVGNMVRAIKEETHGIRSHVLIEEILSYVYNADGRMNAESGAHDDLVSAYYITLMLAKEMYVNPLRPVVYPKGSFRNDMIQVLNGSVGGSDKW